MEGLLGDFSVKCSFYTIINMIFARPATELWIHVNDSDGEALGWYQVPHRSIARFEEIRGQRADTVMPKEAVR